MALFYKNEQLERDQKMISAECIAINEMLLEKNRKYGNSVTNPIGIFASGDAEQLINVRIDDKLSRIRNRQADDAEDAELDLIGYLILKRVVRRARAEKGE